MITTTEMKALEDSCGIPKSVLMEHAGKAVAEVVREKLSGQKNKNILVVCYHGNNGGDGFVAARYLSEEHEVDVLFIGDEERFKPEGKENYEKIANDDRIQLFENADVIEFGRYDIIIDAILGAGVAGNLTESIKSLIEQMNDSKALKVAVDIPTGLNPDTGEIPGKAFDADIIVTFHDIKPGLEKFKEFVVVKGIGIQKGII
ncbi:NAD(P)H-hydrate epimerase [Candidatus Woesearchaeota archaeon]|nr:NAD(P)H-hydrate epimerase [Candidatus Woesearchaeota archaeon]